MILLLVWSVLVAVALVVLVLSVSVSAIPRSVVSAGAPHRPLVRPLSHRVPSSVPVAVVSAALHKRHVDLLASRILSSVFALVQSVLKLAGALVKTDVYLLTHPPSVGPAVFSCKYGLTD